MRKNKARRDRRYEETEVLFYEPPRQIKPLRPYNQTQKDYIDSITNNVLTFAIGSAGTGKTYVAASMAADMLTNKEIEKIVITRPKVEAGEDFGALPGELKEKYYPFIEPFIDALEERLGKSTVEYLLKRGKIEAKPLAFMRGSNFKDSLVILDEAQNTTISQMKLFLTRIGKNCKVIVDGDISQSDIRGISGLDDAVRRVKTIPSVGIVVFKDNDCVRSGIVREILFAYRD